jgi:hypothetical protein
MAEGMIMTIDELIAKAFVGKTYVDPRDHSKHKILSAQVRNDTAGDLLLIFEFFRENGAAIMPAHIELDEQIEIE